MKTYIERLLDERDKVYDVRIKAHYDEVDRLFNERDRQYELRYRAQEQALHEAKADMERRLHALNELRAEVTSDRGRFVSVEKYDAEVSALQAFRSRALGMGIVIGIFAAVVGAMIVHLFGL